MAQLLFGWLIQLHAVKDTLQYTKGDFQFAMWMFTIAAALALIAAILTKETLHRQK